MEIRQTPLFERAVKKITKQDKKDLDEAIKQICENQNIGDDKKKNKMSINDYKIKMNKKTVSWKFLQGFKTT